MLGCKFRIHIHLIYIFFELIDTCWDVNAYGGGDFVSMPIWINRYMLGCKFNIANPKIKRFNELIDTCWDVNLCECSIQCLDTFELIDTCWDVNPYKVTW